MTRLSRRSRGLVLLLLLVAAVTVEYRATYCQGYADAGGTGECSLALLQKNVLNRHRVWTTRDELHQAIVWWTARTYNHRRRHRALGRLSP